MAGLVYVQISQMSASLLEEKIKKVTASKITVTEIKELQFRILRLSVVLS